MTIDQSFDIIEFLHDFFMTDDEDMINAFASYCRVVTKEKGEIIYRPGMEGDSTTFLLDGVLKTYILGPDGTENTFTFFYEYSTAVFLTNDMFTVPGVWCKTLTPCTMIEMVGMNPYKLAEEYPVLWREIMFGTLPFAVRIMNKARAGYTLNAKERYLWFLDKYEPVVDKVSQVEVATFLGITPQTLSRIRAELGNEKEKNNEEESAI